MTTVNAEFPEKLRILFSPSRYKVLYGGRGGAKSWGVARALLIRGARDRLRILCTREVQVSIRDSVHKLLSDQIENLGLGDFYEVQQNTIKGLNGTEFVFKGLKGQTATSLKSYEGVDIVWIEEGQDISKRSLGVLIPTIRKEYADGTTSEIWITFNPEFEDDPVYERFVLNLSDEAASRPPASRVLAEEVNYRDNPWFPSVLEAERIELKATDPDAYEHVWEGKCRRWLEGAIYAKELRAAYDEERIGTVPWDENSPVYTAWDIGRTDDTSVWWFQVVMGEIHIIESYGTSGGDPAHFASQMLGREVSIDIIKGEIVVEIGDLIPGLEHRSKYEYERHFLPHDAKARLFAAAGKSTQQQLDAALGYGMVKIVDAKRRMDREDGIKVARSVFPRCYFDKVKCDDGLRGLRKYRRELQPDDVSLKPQPVHDWASHYADAFRYLAIAWKEEGVEEEGKPTPSDSYGFDEEPENDWMTA